MDKSLLDVLRDNGLSDKEALVYVTNLQLGQAPVSTIARHMRENRVTVYSILKNLIQKWIAKSSTKKNTTYYSVIDADQLAQKISEKVQRLHDVVPQLMAMTTKINTPVKTQFFEWLEWMKTIYEQIIREGDSTMEPDEPFLSFTGSWDMDPHLLTYLEKDFIPRRLTYPRKTQAILSWRGSSYEHYTHQKHESITIDDPLFELANEIVVYGKDQVAILMYSPSEMAALVIQSQTLHNALKSFFRIIRKLYKKPSKRK